MAGSGPASWRVLYHPLVSGDLDSLGTSAAARIIDVIHHRLHLGQPDKVGKPLSGDLAGCRRIRAGALRIVYRLIAGQREVYVLAAGPLRHEEIYTQAARRL